MKVIEIRDEFGVDSLQLVEVPIEYLARGKSSSK